VRPAMPPFSRFAPSKYKNQLLEPAKADGKFAELPPVTPSAAVNGRSIVCGDELLAVSLGCPFIAGLTQGVQLGSWGGGSLRN
jgi:hypothetical protein